MSFGVSRKTVRKVIRSEETAFTYERASQSQPKIGPWRDELDRLLATNAARAVRERLSLTRVFEELRALGYDGGYDAVHSSRGRLEARRESEAVATAFVPLSFAPGEAYQFDWSHEVVVIDGVTTTVKVAHVRLCHSRMMLVRAYPRESQEMVFDAHDRAFALFGGACTRGIYDGGHCPPLVRGQWARRRRWTRSSWAASAPTTARFQQMCSHYLVEPVACTPASGWEKGQVERPAWARSRQRFFSPRVKVRSYGELNAWLEDRLHGLGQGASPPGASPRRRSGRRSRPSGRASCPMPAPSTASTPCRRRCRRRASFASTATSTRSPPRRLGVPSRSAPMPSGSSSGRTGGWSVSTRAPSDAARRSTTPGTTCPCSRASQARSGTAHPSRTGSCRTRSSAFAASSGGAADGDRQMVEILGAVLGDGLPAVEAACAEALAEGVYSAGPSAIVLGPMADNGFDPQHPGPPARAAAARHDHDPPRRCASPTSRAPTAPGTTA